MINISLTPSEKQRILIYAEQASSNQSHWGDGEVELGEETNIFEQCRNTDASLTLSLTQYGIIFNWFIVTTQHGNYLLEEDISILKKTADALGKYCQENDTPYWFDPQDTASMIRFIEVVLQPKQEEIQVKKEVRQLIPPNSPIDDKIKRLAQEKWDVDEFKKNMTEKFRNEKDGLKQADQFLKEVIKKTKGKGLF